MAILCTVFDIFTFDQYRDLETRVRDHSRSLQMTSFDRSHITSYSRSIVIMVVSCTISDTQHDLAANSQLQRHANTQILHNEKMSLIVRY